jgi:hypothetical protein
MVSATLLQSSVQPCRLELSTSGLVDVRLVDVRLVDVRLVDVRLVDVRAS